MLTYVNYSNTIKKPRKLGRLSGLYLIPSKRIDMNSLAQITVPFYSSELLIVEYNNQPYIPMRPVVEGMGLTWASQTVKFNSNKARWGVSIIETPTRSGIQEMLCIPLRKLFGWLTTISVNKVKPELRGSVIKYQNECDDVLWDYWTKEQASNQRQSVIPEQQGLPYPQEVIQVAQQINNEFNSGHYHSWFVQVRDDGKLSAMPLLKGYYPINLAEFAKKFDGLLDFVYGNELLTTGRYLASK